MIQFKKVSYKQFENDCKKLGINCNKEIYDNIKLPTRGSIGSAGYDFYSPIPFELNKENNQITIPTGIRVIMPKGVVLMIYPRSGLGFKTGMFLVNTVGVIDSDYSGSANEGHIMAKLGLGFKDLNVQSGERFMQGIFTPYFITDDDATESTRNGGFGSTGK